MEKVTTFLHDGTIGDVWAALPAIKENYKKFNKKAVLYLTNGQAAIYYPGATHPTQNDGVMVMLNEPVINMIIPLLKSQEYIHDAKIHNGETVQIDLNRIRETFVNQPYHSLSRWYFYVYPDLACDLSQQYIHVPDSEKDLAKGKIIIGRTERYLNPNISYSFLKEYNPDDFLFVGTDLEYAIFIIRYGLKIPRLIIKDFLELAQALKQAKGLISNQTQIFQIAEGLKIPRAVELCAMAPNVEPIGEMAFEFYAQEALEYYTTILLGITPKTQFNGLNMASEISSK